MLVSSKSIFNWSLELFTACVLALGSFVFLFWLLNSIFPLGAGLDVLISSSKVSVENKASTRALRIVNNDETNDINANLYSVAVLATTKNLVKYKPSKQLAWEKAKNGISLFTGDSIQTFDASNASIKFTEQSLLELGENSLIVINRLEEDVIWRERKSYLAMLEGTLRGKVNSHDNKPMFVEITMPSAVASLHSTSTSVPVDFQIKVNANNTSTISVYEGIAEVASLDGKVVKVEENQATVISNSGQLHEPEAMLSAPTLVDPAKDDTYYYKDISPNIRFSWKTEKQTKKSRLLIAKDESFTHLVLEKMVLGNEFIYKNMKQGIYYWKVFSVSETDVEGQPSDVRSLSIRQDSLPPTLKVEFPPAKPGQVDYLVSGTTEPNTTVYISGKEVKNSNGRFSHKIKLKRGPNIIVVESVDKLGNVSYQSGTLHGSF